MATNYALKILNAKTNEWDTVAVFSDNLSLDVIIDMGHTLWDDVDEADDVAVVDMDIDDVVCSYGDFGFDPYMGCYTDDC